MDIPRASAPVRILLGRRDFGGVGSQFVILWHEGRALFRDHAQRADHKLCAVFGQKFKQRPCRFMFFQRNSLLEQNRAGVQPFFHAHDGHAADVVPFHDGPLDGGRASVPGQE